MRATVAATGPDAPVSTCPEWTVHDLVRHLGRVHNWVVKCLRTDPGAESPKADDPPEDWDALLAWWDEQRANLVGGLRGFDPDAPAWVFLPKVNHTAGFWARRQAHETAIHRLDAEVAAAGPDLPSLIFDPEFAADGIDEALNLMIPRRLSREPVMAAGTVLFHAADAGRAWLIELRPGEPPETISAAPGVDADASVVGTADAVYRATWKRPSTAVSGGNLELLAALRTP